MRPTGTTIGNKDASRRLAKSRETGQSERDRESALTYIKELDKRLHYMTSHEMTTNISFTRHTVYADNYRDKEKLTLTEVKKLLSIVVIHDLVFTPINTCMGFSVGYEVILPLIAETLAYCPDEIDHKSLFRCKEDQLPKECTFTWLGRVFKRKRNTDLLAKLGLTEIREYGYYEY
jgi:hypothetical protein